MPDHLSLNTNQLGGQWYIDWMSAGTKSLNQNTGAFMITDGLLTSVFPSRDNKSVQANTSLNEFYQSVGVPGKLKSDRAPEFCGPNTVFLDTARKKGIVRTLVPEFYTRGQSQTKGQTQSALVQYLQ